MATELLDFMLGERCWHVSAGGATAPSFVLVLGAMVPRERALDNRSQPDVFRLHRGSVELLIWCSWRLQRADRLLASSDQGRAGTGALGSLVGHRIESVGCTGPFRDLHIRFSDGREIATFSDHLHEHSSIETNWELWADGRHLVAGPGSELTED